MGGEIGSCFGPTALLHMLISHRAGRLRIHKYIIARYSGYGIWGRFCFFPSQGHMAPASGTRIHNHGIYTATPVGLIGQVEQEDTSNRSTLSLPHSGHFRSVSSAGSGRANKAWHPLHLYTCGCIFMLRTVIIIHYQYYTTRIEMTVKLHRTIPDSTLP